MTVLIVTALIPAAVVAAIILEPQVESWVTRKRLIESHRALGATSNTDNVGPEPLETSCNLTKHCDQNGTSPTACLPWFRGYGKGLSGLRNSRLVRPEPGEKFYNHMSKHTRDEWHRSWLLSSGQYVKTSDPDAGRKYDWQVVGENGPEVLQLWSMKRWLA